MVKLDWSDIFMWSLFGLLFVLCVCGFYHDTVTVNKWFKECVADGHKEYECAPIMRRGGVIGPKGIPLK